MQRLDEIASKQRLRAAIFELEGLSQPSMLSVAAIFVLKNELGGDGSGPREIRVSRRFSIPGSLRERLASGIRRLRREGGAKGVAGLFRDLGAWWRGEDRERFRDRCDRYFWERMVPVIGRDFGDLAGPLANTINEVIINYAEYSFPPRAFGRRVTAQIFLTTGPDRGDLAYGIVRPEGSRLATFDPLKLRAKRPGPIAEMKRGWGHAILMEQTLFLSFDETPSGRGVLFVVGPEET